MYSCQNTFNDKICNSRRRIHINSDHTQLVNVKVSLFTGDNFIKCLIYTHMTAQKLIFLSSDIGSAKKLNLFLEINIVTLLTVDVSLPKLTLIQCARISSHHDSLLSQLLYILSYAYPRDSSPIIVHLFKTFRNFDLFVFFIFSHSFES